MKNIFLGFLIIFLISILVFGCGKNYDGGGSTPVPSNNNNHQDPSSFYVIWSSCFPASGETNVNINSNLIIKFNNPVSIEAFTPYWSLPANDHTAGEPTGTSMTYEWTENDTKLTLSGLRGWSSAESDSTPPFKIHLINNGFIDIYGNVLPIGATLSEYWIKEEFWRYAPTIEGSIISYYTTVEAGADQQTGEAWTFLNTLVFFDSLIFTSIEADRFDHNGPFNPRGRWLASNNQEIWLQLYNAPEELNWGGFPLLFNPFTTGETWDKEHNLIAPYGLVTTETEVIGIENINTDMGILRAVRTQVRLKDGGIPFINAWLAYNYGIVKSEHYYDMTSPQAGKIQATFEAFDYYKP